MRFSTCILGAVALFCGSAHASGMNMYKRALELNLVSQLNTIITQDSLTSNKVKVNFTANNPIPIPLNITRVTGTAGINGAVYASFDQVFTNFVLPPLGSANSGTFGNVLLVQGVAASLGLVTQPTLDLIDSNITILGYNFIPINLVDLSQKAIPSHVDSAF